MMFLRWRYSSERGDWVISVHDYNMSAMQAEAVGLTFSYTCIHLVGDRVRDSPVRRLPGHSRGSRARRFSVFRVQSSFMISRGSADYP